MKEKPRATTISAATANPRILASAFIHSLRVPLSSANRPSSNANRGNPQVTLSKRLLRFFFFVPQPFDKHLLLWFVVVHEQVANAAPADKVANFFGQILGVSPAGSEGLGMKRNL